MKKYIYFAFVALFLVSAAYSNEKINMKWFKGYGGKGADMFRFVGYDKEGSYYVTGIIERDSIYFGNGIGIDFTSLNSKYVLLKFDRYDVCQWARTTQAVKYGECHIMPYKLTVDSDGNIIILSTWYKSDYRAVKNIDFGNGVILDGKGGVDIILLKYDSNGNCIWGKCIGSGANDSDYDMTMDSSNNIYISGYSGFSTNSNGPGDIDFGSGIILKIDTMYVGHFAKYSKDGNCLWAKKLSHPTCNTGNSGGYITFCQNGTIMLFGSFGVNTDFGDGNYVDFTNSGTYDFETFIANYSLDGNLNWVKILGIPAIATISTPVIKQNSEFYFTGQFSGAN